MYGRLDPSNSPWAPAPPEIFSPQPFSNWIIYVDAGLCLSVLWSLSEKLCCYVAISTTCPLLQPLDTADTDQSLKANPLQLVTATNHVFLSAVKDLGSSGHRPRADFKDITNLLFI